MSLTKKLLVFVILLWSTASQSQSQLSKSIYFDFESASTSVDTVDAIAEIISSHKQKCKVEVHGYTDNVGRSSYNKTLSETRAKSVGKLLSQKGVSDSLLQIFAHGESNAKYSNETSEGRAKNRRVDILLFFEKEVEAVAKPDTPVIVPIDSPAIIDTVKTEPKPKPKPEAEIVINYDLLELGYNEPIQQFAINNLIQKFTINPHRDTFIMGREGTIVQIPAESYPSDRRTIVIELIECYQPADAVFFNLSTQSSEGNFLVRNEAIRIRAYEMEEPYFEAAKPISIFIPTQEKTSKPKNVWYGQNALTGAGVVWEKADPNFYTSSINDFKSSNKTLPLPFGEQFSSFAYEHFLEITRVFGRELPENAIFYAFQTTKNNWLSYGHNLKLPTEDLTKCTLKIVGANKNTSTQLLYGDNRTTIPSKNFDANKEIYTFPEMPKGSSFWILSTDKEKELKMVFEKVTLGKKTLEAELLKYDSVSEFYEALKELNP